MAQAGIGASFPGALFVAVPPVEMEWPQREALAAAAGANDGAITYSRPAAGGGEPPVRWVARPVHLRHRRRPAGRPLRHQGLADLAFHRLLVGRDRDPARGRGDPPGRDGRRPLHRHRRLGEPGIADPFLAALGALDPERPPKAASKPFSKNRDGFVMGEGAAALVLESAESARARGATILGYVLGCGEKGDGFHRTRSSPTGAGDRGDARGARRCGPGAGGDRPRQRPRHLDAGERQDGGAGLLGRVRRAGGTAADLVEQVDDRPHADRGAGAIEAVVSLLTIRHGRIPPTINYAVPDPP